MSKAGTSASNIVGRKGGMTNCQLSVIDSHNANEIERGLAMFGREPNGAIITTASPSTGANRSAEYVDRILKGAKPSELPVQAPTKYELVLNLKAAKAIGLAIPSSLLTTADEVIE